MFFYRDAILKAASVRIYGMLHSSGEKGLNNCLSTYRSLVLQQPAEFLVESSEKSIELSRFVWDSQPYSAESFCREEYPQTETAAIAACSELSLPISRIRPIDIDSFKTRAALARNALFHPWESLVLISRYHGVAPELKSLEEAARWRAEFKMTCPHAFEILFTEREAWMADQIKRAVMGGSSHIAVLVGLSHVDAVYDLLVNVGTVKK